MIEHVWCGGCVERGAALTQELSSIRDVLVRAGAAVERVGVDDHWHPVSPAQQVYELATERDDLVRERDELHRLVCNARAYINPKEHSEWEAAAAEEAENCDAKMARLSQERDAARFEVEEMRALVRELLVKGDAEGMNQHAHWHYVLGPRARALLSRPPTVAALHAREALAALAWCDAVLRRGTEYELARTADTYEAYTLARVEREKAEKEEQTE